MQNPVLKEKNFGIDQNRQETGLAAPPDQTGTPPQSNVDTTGITTPQWIFPDTHQTTPPIPQTAKMTRAGVASALGVFFVFLFGGAVSAWVMSPNTLVNQRPSLTFYFTLLLACIAAFGLAVVITRKPNLAKYLGALYAVLEGGILGYISKIYNVQYPGIVISAIGVTLGVFAVVATAYGFGLIKVTNRLKNIIAMATIGALLFYFASFIVALLGGPFFPSGGGVIGIGISVVLAGIAAANLLTDFAFIDEAIAAGAERDYDYYGAFGILVTLVWLYLEVLRLLSKLRS